MSSCDDRVGGQEGQYQQEKQTEKCFVWPTWLCDDTEYISNLTLPYRAAHSAVSLELSALICSLWRPEWTWALSQDPGSRLAPAWWPNHLSFISNWSSRLLSASANTEMWAGGLQERKLCSCRVGAFLDANASLVIVLSVTGLPNLQNTTNCATHS